MPETKIQIKDYLAEYVKGKYNNGADEPVRIPDNSDLYHTIWELMCKRPKGVSPIDEGNLIIFLPDRREGKDPLYYNYLRERSQKIIEAKIQMHFNNDLHQELEENYAKGKELDHIDVVHRFMCLFGIESISEDALLKNYYRWRGNVRKKRNRREYNKKKLK